MKKHTPSIMLIIAFIVFIYTLKEDDTTSQLLAGIGFLTLFILRILSWRNRIKEQ